jgi:hypothetical protein
MTGIYILIYSFGRVGAGGGGDSQTKQKQTKKKSGSNRQGGAVGKQEDKQDKGEVKRLRMVWQIP